MCDLDADAEEKFSSTCPELMGPEYNISIHSGMNVETSQFDKFVSELSGVTYVFVALGDDGDNISTAIQLSVLLKRLNRHPIIQAVVYDTDTNAALSEVHYPIDFIGDLRTSYSKEVIMDLELEKIALERHLRWGKEKQFWQRDYNYKSSIASAIHRKMKQECKIPGIEKAPELRTEEELWAIRRLEHRRWNAYMRSEGYVYAGTQDPKARDDMAKMHHCLVPFEKLPLKEQVKDDD